MCNTFAHLQPTAAESNVKQWFAKQTTESHRMPKPLTARSPHRNILKQELGRCRIHFN
jgi:hypothetical protein